jgi:hypothetical protein
LAEYDENLNQILDRIFDEYGLIICGWSADYDAQVFLIGRPGVSMPRWCNISASRCNGTLLNTVAAGSRKVGGVLDEASQGDSITLRSLSSPIALAHPKHHLRFQKTTGKRGSAARVGLHRLGGVLIGALVLLCLLQ